MGLSTLEVPVQKPMSHTNNFATLLQMFVLVIQLYHYKGYLGGGGKSIYHLKSCSHHLHGSTSGVQEKFFSLIKISTCCVVPYIPLLE